jgi:hypothetical protein
MGCCGQKRAALRAAASPHQAPSLPAASAPPGRDLAPLIAVSGPAGAPQRLLPAIALRYLAGASIALRGAVTGRLYEFSRVRAVQAVDAQDAAQLLRTSFFRPVN